MAPLRNPSPLRRIDSTCLYRIQCCYRLDVKLCRGSASFDVTTKLFVTTWPWWTFKLYRIVCYSLDFPSLPPTVLLVLLLTVIITISSVTVWACKRRYRIHCYSLDFQTLPSKVLLLPRLTCKTTLDPVLLLRLSNIVIQCVYSSAYWHYNNIFRYFLTI